MTSSADAMKLDSTGVVLDVLEGERLRSPDASSGACAVTIPRSPPRRASGTGSSPTRRATALFSEPDPGAGSDLDLERVVLDRR